MSAKPEIDDGYSRVASVGEVPRGRGIAVDVDGIEIAVFNVEGEFHAISNRCPHQGAPLYKAGEKKINAEDTWTESRGGVNEDDLTVSCPWHLWELDIESGEHEVSGKCIGTFDAKVVDGEVFVRI
ncbi:Rieske (2Fe-2S) protein [Halobellus rarus]|uniref:Rieske (2Fe-2S) protein n=1 Tax=Halobellus rarus TaxID=1126237 RepID=A0ABD6CQW3_9EURY|nr:Rieske (2Fe-2S) protein [Halobellus rarus]